MTAASALTAADSAALATLADIELPAPPEWQPPLLLLLTAAVLASAAVIALTLWLRRRRAARGPARPVRPPATETSEQQALTRLAALESDWSAGGLDDREAGFRLCALLRRGLGLPQLDGAHPPAGIDGARWRAYLVHLREIRYRPRHPPLTPARFGEARDWLVASAARRHADA